MSDLINHKELAENRLATQYKESSNLIKYIRSLLSEADTLEAIFHDIIESRWLDNAVGEQLDIIGAIVGQRRQLYDITPLTWFGFVGGVIADSFGDLNDASVGSRFRAIGESEGGIVTLEDTEYRLFIRGKIAKNHSLVNPEDVKSQLAFMFNIDSVDVRDVGTAKALINIGTLLDGNTKYLIKNAGLVPKPIGVEYIYSEFFSAAPFGFVGTPNGLGFADLSTPSDGGKFASIF